MPIEIVAINYYDVNHTQKLLTFNMTDYDLTDRKKYLNE